MTNRSAKNAKRGKRGKTGIVTIRGQQRIDPVTNGANGTQLFTSNNYFFVSPDDFGGTIASIANRYNKYRFTHLNFEYIPVYYNLETTTATQGGTANSFAFGYESDPVPTFTVTYSNILNLHHALTVPMNGWMSRTQNMLKVRPNKADTWYYTERDASDSAGQRSTIQGAFYGEAASTITSATFYGYIYVHYTVEFSDQCPDQGVTVSRLIRENRLGKDDGLRELAAQLKVMAGVCDVDSLPEWERHRFSRVLPPASDEKELDSYMDVLSVISELEAKLACRRK